MKTVLVFFIELFAATIFLTIRNYSVNAYFNILCERVNIWILIFFVRILAPEIFKFLKIIFLIDLLLLTC